VKFPQIAFLWDDKTTDIRNFVIGVASNSERCGPLLSQDVSQNHNLRIPAVCCFWHHSRLSLVAVLSPVDDFIVARGNFDKVLLFLQEFVLALFIGCLTETLVPVIGDDDSTT
jgi:hypothetical protein